MSSWSGMRSAERAMCSAKSKLNISFCWATAFRKQSVEDALAVPDTEDWKSSRVCIMCRSERNTRASPCAPTQVWVNRQRKCILTVGLGLFLCSDYQEGEPLGADRESLSHIYFKDTKVLLANTFGLRDPITRFVTLLPSAVLLFRLLYVNGACVACRLD